MKGEARVRQGFLRCRQSRFSKAGGVFDTFSFTVISLPWPGLRPVYETLNAGFGLSDVWIARLVFASSDKRLYISPDRGVGLDGDVSNIGNFKIRHLVPCVVSVELQVLIFIEDSLQC